MKYLIRKCYHALLFISIHKRCLSKIHKTLKGKAPLFIIDLLYLHKPSRMFRSSSECLLQVGKSSTKFHGERSFAFSAANIWNKLPSKVRHAPSLEVFKSRHTCSRSIYVRNKCIFILHAIITTFCQNCCIFRIFDSLYFYVQCAQKSYY